MLALLALCHPFGFLCFFAFLHACLDVRAWVLVLAYVIKPNSYYPVLVHTRLWYTRPQVPFRKFAWWHVCHLYSNSMELWDTRSKPTFVILWHPFLFDNMFVCPFVCLTCLFSPVWLSLHSFFTSLLSYLLVCWLLSLFVACTCLEQGRLERGHDSLSASKKGKDASKKTQAQTGSCSVD